MRIRLKDLCGPFKLLGSFCVCVFSFSKHLLSVYSVADLCKDLGIVSLQRTLEASRKVQRGTKKSAELLSQQLEASVVHSQRRVITEHWWTTEQ